MKGNGWKRKNLKIDFWCNGHTIGWFMVSLCFMVFSAYPIFGKIQEEMPLVPGQPVEARGFFPAWKLVKCVMHWWWDQPWFLLMRFSESFAANNFSPKKHMYPPKCWESVGFFRWNFFGSCADPFLKYVDLMSLCVWRPSFRERNSGMARIFIALQQFCFQKNATFCTRIWLLFERCHVIQSRRWIQTWWCPEVQ